MGYSTLKPKQFEAMLEFIGGQNVFVALPTDSEKSLSYSIIP